ncbi:hypothetical protein [Streptomyces sp. NPDC047928]|uniref:hypothetical protein n=1 Tax=unclassified Streptomyces TaxID=2593676 RepID=UPI0037131E14
MVSSPHEAMHRIFQEYPKLFFGVSKVLGVAFAQPASIVVLPTDLTETRPVERRVDTLLRFETDDDGPFLLAVEAQGKRDLSKPASWAYYLAYLHNKYRQPPVLLVVCQDHATAEWASQPVHIGPPQWRSLTVRPLVAGPHNMPVITDPAEAFDDLALATLAAITHVSHRSVDAILKALCTALQDVPEDLAAPIIEFTAQGLGTRPAARIWRNLVAVDLSFYKSPLSEEIRDEGRLQGQADALLLFLEQRGITVTDDVRERVTGCGDPEIMRGWLARAATAVVAEDVFSDG